jgi:hypothetical protein
MSYRPRDFFLDAIDFFGVLVPGAALLFLWGPDLLAPIWAPDERLSTAAIWVVFLLASYVLGHFLHGLSELIPALPRTWIRAKRTEPYYGKANKSLNLPEEFKEDRQEAYYHGFAVVNLKNAAAHSHVEHKSAEFKLFRSLVLVFAIDGLLSTVGSERVDRIALDAILSVAAWLRFSYLRDWTWGLTFEYCAELDGPAVVEE